MADARAPHPEALDGDLVELAPYLVVEPFVAGRIVIDLDPAHPNGADRLAVVGKARPRVVRSALERGRSAATDGDELRLPVEDGAADVVLSLGMVLPVTVTDHELDGWTAELRRIVRDDGFCVVRVDGPGLRERVHAALAPRFSAIDWVTQIPFFGFSFSVPQVSEVAVNEDLFPVSHPPSPQLAFASVSAARPYQLAESLIVPIAPLTTSAGARAEPRVSAQPAASAAEDPSEGSATLLVRTLRRDIETQLRCIADLNNALELSERAREHIERRLAAAGNQLPVQDPNAPTTPSPKDQ